MGKYAVKFNSFVDRLTVTNYYNLNGELIPMDTKEYENVNVTIVRKPVKILGKVLEDLEENNIIVNGEIVGYYVFLQEVIQKICLFVCDDAG